MALIKHENPTPDEIRGALRRAHGFDAEHAKIAQIRTGGPIATAKRILRTQITMLRVREEMGIEQPVTAQRIAELDELDELMQQLMEAVESYRQVA